MNVPEVAQHRLWQTLQWIVRPCEFMSSAHLEFGDTFAVDVMGLGELVLLAKPEDVAEVFRSDPNTLRTGESNKLVEPLLGSRSLLVLDSPDHLPARRLLGRHFSRAAVASYLPDLRELTTDVARDIPEEVPFKLHDMIRRVTLRFMLKIVFGSVDEKRNRDFLRAFTPLTGELVGALAYLTPLQRDIGPGSPGRWFHSKIAALNELIYEEIDRQRNQSGPNHSILAQLTEDGSDIGTLRDQIVTILAAGHETVGSAVAWAMHWIHDSPEVLRRIREELISAQDQFEDAPFLEAACLEALRISPVAEAVSRVAAIPMDLNGYEIKAGSLVTPAIHLIHHRPDIYPEPMRFRPERFLDSKFRPSEFLPFGGGQRMCVGRGLAIEEMKIIVGTLLSSHDFRLVGRPIPRGVRRNVTIAPAGGVRVVAKRLQTRPRIPRTLHT